MQPFLSLSLFESVFRPPESSWMIEDNTLQFTLAKSLPVRTPDVLVHQLAVVFPVALTWIRRAMQGRAWHAVFQGHENLNGSQIRMIESDIHLEQLRTKYPQLLVNEVTPSFSLA
ncbi:hypothetical protein GUITHDRAFT_105548 [Guillardia theta CCMP2712]|uniref:Uncharacterized protein n=1 Tax=Guillardia theta (strain CCMP2712) TaxID=905079 RepID=L1JKA4_GUITC|nr:hypothetical protein GUITHDRAFT_105548 [Guillardia theta CCMP2712]EKX48921.1 hypothetical protein GUITHDRAFT_105548 [Guillardia theta CCMP2712]|eukprot:XP_005835901.1 hypothetical protein GUITHDRAFT_105548 [Guillardia theta CCMP2712]